MADDGKTGVINWSLLKRVKSETDKILASGPSYDSRKTKYLKAFAPPDEEAVLAGCPRIIEAMTDQDIFAPWETYRLETLLTVIARLDRGEERARELFKQAPGFDDTVLVSAMERALESPGPALCTTISEACSNRCESGCPYWRDKQVTSPIKILGKDRILTESTGFWFCEVKDGQLVSKKPDIDGLVTRFMKDYEHIIIAETGLVHVFKDNHWQLLERQYVLAYAQQRMLPRPRESIRIEFLRSLMCENIKSHEWFSQAPTGFINMKNGVYDIAKGVLLPHDPSYGFRYILPYDFDITATCPQFDQFLEDVTLGKDDIIDVLVEFMGYALAGGPCYAEKALFLSGFGSNGKSTFMRVLMALAGEGNYSAMTLTALNDAQNRYALDGRLFNLGEETSPRALGNSEVFKAMVTGGSVDVKKLYSNPYIIHNRCKLIVACNELPKSSDRSEGLYRRLIFVPFDATFTKDSSVKKDPRIAEKLITELPGIFNKCMAGLKRLEASDWRFSESATLDAVLLDYKRENDNIFEWFSTNIEVTGKDDDFLFKEKMYEDYVDFCEEGGYVKMSKSLVFKSIKKWEPQMVHETKRYQKDGRRIRVILGLRFSHRGRD